MTKKSIGKSILINIIFILVCVIIAYIISNILFVSIPVRGSSMETTLHDGDRILLYKLEKDYKYGDIIVYNTHKIGPDGKEQHVVKRLLGLPGDEMEIVRNAEDSKYYLYRNGEKVIEDYLDDDKQLSYQQARITVGEGEFYYLGDNRPVSSDSRTGTLGKFDDLVGRVIVRYNLELKNFSINIIKRIK